MAPLAQNEMHKNLYALATWLCDFPKLQESSLILSEVEIYHLNTATLKLHQMKLSHCQIHSQLEIVVLDHLGLIHFQVMSHELSSSFGFP